MRYNQREKGITLLETAIALPTILLIVAVTFDLARIYNSIVLCQDVALMAVKVSVAADPTTETPNTSQLTKTAPGEVTGSADRAGFWRDFLAALTAQVPAKTQFTEKELKSLNLAYGYLNSLNNRIAFPIPLNPTITQLGGVTNCSVFFTYDLVTWANTTSDDSTYHRIFTVECAVPTLGLSLFGGAMAPNGFLTVKRTAYAFDSGAAL